MPKVDLKSVMFGLRLSGCVQLHLEGFAAELISAGYALLPIRDYLRSAAHLGRWADSCGVAIEGLTHGAVAEFAHHKCQCAFAKRHGRCPTRRYVLRVRRYGGPHCLDQKTDFIRETSNASFSPFREWGRRRSAGER